MSTNANHDDTNMPLKNTKENRYYLRHREEILEKNKQRRLQDPEYAKRKLEREQKKAEKIAAEITKKADKEKKRLERLQKMEEELTLKKVDANLPNLSRCK